MEVRSSYGPYLEACERYLTKLLPMVSELQYSRGGPIIMVQLENEYGSYGNDDKYKNFLLKTFRKCGITELLFTSDNGTGIRSGQIAGALMTANFQEKDHGHLILEYLKNVKQPGMPIMVMEFWTGWFDHWGEKHHVWPQQEFDVVLRWLLDQEISLNFYMFHGGTNFGFMNGANEGFGATNEGSTEPYGADVTSYDYNAPVAENGDLTDKYYMIKDILKEKVAEYVSSDLPEVPKHIESWAYGDIAVTSYMTFDEILDSIEPLRIACPVSMECLNINNEGGQGYGYILYRATVGAGEELKLSGYARDRAVVYVNGKQVAVVDWHEKDFTVTIGTTKAENTIDIVVENLGRVNYAEANSPVMNLQRKGLQEEVHLDGKPIQEWDVYPLEFKRSFIERLQQNKNWHDGSVPVQPLGGTGNTPSVSNISFEIEGNPKDTFVNMLGWGKGVVLVNGYNLGRYWDIGPQKTLYLPAPLLKEGQNLIIVFELHKAHHKISCQHKADLGEVIIHKTHIPFWWKLMIGGLKGLVRLGAWPVIRLLYG